MRDWRIWTVVAAVGLVMVVAVLTFVRPSTNFVATTATLSVIDGDVQVGQTDAEQRPGRNGEALVAGTAVRALGPGGRAVLTFRDGSTLELEPDASVKIEDLSLGTRGELIVRLYQDRGTTWAFVQPQLSPNSRFHVKTPSVTAVARGTGFELDVRDVDAGGTATTVTVFQGRVDLVAAGKVVPLAASYQAEVMTGSPPGDARQVTGDICTRFEVTTEALITVTDPQGRTSGQTKLGTVSQIPKAIVAGPQTVPQTIDVFAPFAGEWEIGIVPRRDGGPVQLVVRTVVGAEVVSTKAMTMSFGPGERLVTRIRLGADGRAGAFEAPVRSHDTRANLALPSEGTTTVPLPQAKVFPPAGQDLALTCVPPEESQRSDNVKPVRSPTQSGR